ncbi:MAG: Nramp family divalent metal transporter [Chitinophagaceae bacterium]|nr:Nramp family divalent metal transporter [Chitinophagaceae bacterium]MCA6469984.1 Nramp family divalent metal transporter [Chitinophagaceae bacterium]MCA6477031.1 Nramp family divalent metal transporter [Chitinophagaceae bacterium]MCA6479869.1 Nramp family divalent metal transporter [Chitinophagaceae bacterium]MCA6498060.1 Nramp family divalent metal transporter [Chitinophagaceae bacterium]
MKNKYSSGQASLSEVHETVDTTVPRKGWRRILAYIGPAYLVSVGYMDPGNWATDLQGGARFGYQLIWVLLMSNLMALLLQSLSARLGIVTRRDLAQANRENYPPLVNFSLYILSEIAIAACDMAEVLGMAIGIHLLTGLPLLTGTLITIADTFLFLLLHHFGIRKMEAFIISLVAIIGMCFLIQIIMAKPDMSSVVTGFVPTNLTGDSLFIAIGIIGATVMPHNLYLHSALVQTRKISNDREGIRRAIKYNVIDSAIALNAAFLVNAAILILAASLFFANGHTNVAQIQEAHRLLEPLLGNQWAPILFAVALIAAGQSSTITGTLAGQIVMEGYLHLRINPWLRRLITRLLAIIPALLVILIYGESKVDDLLVISQIILSLQLGFAVIPLIHFVSDKSTMGEFVISPLTKTAAWIVAAILVFLNGRLVLEQLTAFYMADIAVIWKYLMVIPIGWIFWLFLVMTFIPILKKRKAKKKASLHGDPITFSEFKDIQRKCVAIALDFTEADRLLIENAVAQKNDETKLVLIHVVESASAGYFGASSDDEETRADRIRLEHYQSQLLEKGLKVDIALGFGNRVKEIVRLTNDCNADLLVMGAHRHAGLKDYLFGETIEGVRHALSIPVLVVNVQ